MMKLITKYIKIYLNNSPNSRLLFNSNIEDLMQSNHLLITNFSTLIDEFSYLNKPVIILNDSFEI